jgi:hypothetical protein
LEDFRILKEHYNYLIRILERRYMRAIIGSFMLIFVLMLFTIPAFAAGPWKGRIIDIETKEPLEGAVVLAVWDRNYRTPTGGSSYFYEAKEVLTDQEGRFEISSYTPINLLPLISYIEGPEFIIFKPGYVSLRMALGKYLTGEIGVEPYSGKLSGYMIKVSPSLIELQKLKTREERKINLYSLPPSIPDNKMPKLIQLMNKEEIDLGLQPSHQRGKSK